LTRLVHAQPVNEAHHAHVLARLETAGVRAIGRRQVERRDLVAFHFLARHHERTETAPRRAFVQLRFRADQDVGQLAVRHLPRRERVLIHRVAQHVDDRAKQMPPHHRVVFGTNVEARVLVGDARHRRTQRTKLVDVRGIGIDRARQRFGLAAALLVRLVEDVLQLRVVREHALVEMLGDRGAMLGKNGGRSLHAGHLFSGKRCHSVSLLKRC
jgi:hypothetical protein